MFEASCDMPTRKVGFDFSDIPVAGLRLQQECLLVRERMSIS